MSVLRVACLFALPLLAGGALAQAPAAKAPAPMTVPGVSPAGNAALAKFRQGDTQGKQIYLQIRDTSMQIQLETQRPKVNVDLLGTLLKKLDGLSAQFRARQTDQLIQVLKALPEGDRIPFLKAAGIGPRPTPPTTAPAH